MCQHLLLCKDCTEKSSLPINHNKTVKVYYSTKGFQTFGSVCTEAISSQDPSEAKKQKLRSGKHRFFFCKANKTLFHQAL
jgi:hypothetical protein